MSMNENKNQLYYMLSMVLNLSFKYLHSNDFMNITDLFEPKLFLLLILFDQK